VGRPGSVGKLQRERQLNAHTATRQSLDGREPSLIAIHERADALTATTTEAMVATRRSRPAAMAYTGRQPKREHHRFGGAQQRVADEPQQVRPF
jgi:hypothetical protein